MIKPELYTGQELKGLWTVTRKLDGIRALKTNSGYVSRNGKPLFNLEKVKGEDVEVFCGSWKETVSRVRTKNSIPISQDCIYSLSPLDDKLFISVLNNPTAVQVENLLKSQLEKGDEGLVLRQETTWYKVKPVETYDVLVIGEIKGKGRNVGRLGAFMTEMGKVGTGFTDIQRQDLLGYRGLIEVECMELTPNGKFRHPRFIRIREDK